MRNLYSITTNRAAIIALFRVVNRYVGRRCPGGVAGLQGANRAQRGRRPRTRHGAVGKAFIAARPDGGDKKRAAKLEAMGSRTAARPISRC